MDTLDGMKAVVAVVETQSFTAASERLGLSKALVSKYVGQVEKKLGTRLFNRTTRQLALTDAGKRYYDHALSLLEQFAVMEDAVSDEQQSPKGLLRVSAPLTFGEMNLAKVLPKFLQAYPDLSVEVHLSNSAVDMIEDGIDVRLRVGGVDDSSMIARHIRTYPLILCASPAYIKEKGLPVTPEDLLHHSCIIDSNFRIGRQWPMISPTGEAQTIDVESVIAVNSPKAVQEIALAGGGIGMVPSFIVEQAITEGKLEALLPDYTTLEFGLFAIYPHRKYVSRKVRCFIDFVLDEFA